MIEATLEVQDDLLDLEMVRTSWFTSLIMNSSGNYKRPIKPDKLYTSKYALDSQGNAKEATKMTIEQHEAEQDRLKDIFKLTDR
ncbi:MAG: hypothetical protein K0S71_326 [Clostridia bacterium]|jgi:hypothetical protein|nr:hypothetical protein [Clostridia bacterium]